MKNDLILSIYSKPQTVFTLDEIAQIFPGISYEAVKNRVRYFTNVGKLKRLHQGVYGKGEYNPLELVNKLYKPSYISLETVLIKGGVVFQYYERIFAVAYLTRNIRVGEITIQYRQIKGEVLTNMEGIDEENGYFIASLERAFLDAVFIYKDYHFDNLGALNWDRINELKRIYKNKAFEKRVEEYYKNFKEDYGQH